MHAPERVTNARVSAEELTAEVANPPDHVLDMRVSRFDACLVYGA